MPLECLRRTQNRNCFSNEFQTTKFCKFKTEGKYGNDQIIVTLKRCDPAAACYKTSYTAILWLIYPNSVGRQNLGTFSTDSASELDVLGHDSDTFSVNCTQVCVFEKPYQVGFRSFLNYKFDRYEN